MRRMDKNGYRVAQAHLKLTEPEMAELLGISRRTANSYANGAPINPGISIALQLIVTMCLTPADVPRP